MVTLRDEFEERLEEFREEYGFYEQDEVVQSFAVIGELLDLVFIGDEAAMTMSLLKEVIRKGTRPDWSELNLGAVSPDPDWREVWRSIDGWDASSCPPFLDELHDLNAFANFGILPIWDIHADNQNHIEVRHLKARFDDSANPAAWVIRVCDKIERLEKLVSHGADGASSLFYLPNLRQLALARLKLDDGQPLTVQELAILSGVSVKRLQNAIYAQSEGAPSVSKSGAIAKDGVDRWLNDRDYKWSLWKQVSQLYPLSANWGRDIEYHAFDELETHADYVFVPVASDGTVFHPGLARGRGEQKSFHVGPKGDEKVIGTFRDALKELSEMETPRWRRPNAESGKWGIVSGQSWKRMRMAELEVMAR